MKGRPRDCQLLQSKESPELPQISQHSIFPRSLLAARGMQASSESVVYRWQTHRLGAGLMGESATRPPRSGERAVHSRVQSWSKQQREAASPCPCCNPRSKVQRAWFQMEPPATSPQQAQTTNKPHEDAITAWAAAAGRACPCTPPPADTPSSCQGSTADRPAQAA